MPTSSSPRMPPPTLVRMMNALVDMLDSAKNKLLPPPVAMIALTGGALASCMLISVAAELGLADLLKDGPQPAQALAEATGVDPGALYRIMRALASLGVFAERPDGRFELTRLAECLRSDVPDSMRGWLRMLGSPQHWTLWGSMLQSLRNGKSASENLHGVHFFDWLDENPEQARLFNESMTSNSRLTNPAVVAAYDFSKLGSVVDVAGGHGSLLAAILAATPHLRGVLFDQPKVIEDAGTGELFRQPELAARCERIAGNFFESVPAGHDAYLLKWILHDWSDEQALAILGTCRRAMERGARLLIIEMVIEPGNKPSFGKIVDISMLILTGGRERTEQEYGELLRQAGFELRRVVPTASPYSIIEAVAL